MKIIKEVPTIEVLRCFVVADMISNRSHKGHMKRINTKDEYINIFERCKRATFKMTRNELEKFVSNKDEVRLEMYNNLKWYEAIMATNEMGTWIRAGELPHWVTNKSLDITAKNIFRLKKNKNSSLYKKRIRARYALDGILNTCIDYLIGEKYLQPIVVLHNSHSRGRSRLRYQVLGDIDDGNMRSIAMAMCGLKELKVFWGEPVQK